MTFLCLYEIANFIVLYRYCSSEYILYLLSECIQSNFLSAPPIKYFGTVFKKIYWCSPREYLAEIKGL
ncbi:MAG: hypothetical protein ACFWTN_04195 [Clostridium sp.]